MVPVRFHTLGCRLNQLETEGVAFSFRSLASPAAGVAPRALAAAPVPDPDEPQLHIVNTCTVTSMAEQKARRLVRRLLADNPGACVVATGCYAQVAADELGALDPRVVVVKGGRKDLLTRLPATLEARLAASSPPSGGFALAELVRSCLDDRVPYDPFAFTPDSPAERTRSSLKVEDGCDNACAYCLVHVARGRAVSLDPAPAVERARAMAARGASEITLTGVNLSHYRSGGLDFPGLLSLLVAETDRVRFRISSYEPDGIGDAFLNAFASPRVCSFAHLAAQSGCDGTLARMGRKYGAEKILRAIENLRSAKDRPYIGADIIAGFPGETDDEFARTLATCGEAEFAWMHIFPFSSRPGTPAATMKPRVPERVAGERVAALKILAEKGLVSYARSCEGMEEIAIVEGNGRATSGNYLSLEVESPRSLAKGDAFRCRIENSPSGPRACFLEFLG